MKVRKRKRKREWKDREKKRKEEREQSDKWSSTIRLCRDVGKRKNRLQRGRQRAQPSRMADITNVIIHPTLRPPRVWGTKNVGQWILANPAWPKKRWVILVCLRFHAMLLLDASSASHVYYPLARAKYCSQHSIPKRRFVSIIWRFSANVFIISSSRMRSSIFRIMGEKYFFLCSLQFLLRPCVARESRECETTREREREKERHREREWEQVREQWH